MMIMMQGQSGCSFLFGVGGGAKRARREKIYGNVKHETRRCRHRFLQSSASQKRCVCVWRLRFRKSLMRSELTHSRIRRMYLAFNAVNMHACKHRTSHMHTHANIYSIYCTPRNGCELAECVFCELVVRLYRLRNCNCDGCNGCDYRTTERYSVSMLLLSSLLYSQPRYSLFYNLSTSCTLWCPPPPPSS